jgi:NADH-quinone oxidoreductase subunit N
MAGPTSLPSLVVAVDTPDVDWVALSPTLALLSAAAVALLGSVFVPRTARKAFAAAAVAAGFATAFGLAIWVFSDSEQARLVIADSLARDRFAAFAQLLVCGAGLLAVGVSWSERLGDEHAGEYYALLATAAAGMAFFVQAENLMLLFLGLEWFSISLYVMCAIAGERPQSLEAGLKYLIVGSFGSAVLLFGSALIYGATGELGFREIAQATSQQSLTDDPLLLAGLAMLLTGLGFKASAAPFHMWTPDVYEGAPTPVTAFMSAATKTAALVLTLRVLVTGFPELEEFWTVAVAVLACASLAIGNLAALVQRNVKRMLAYSSISHAGFLLIPVAANNGIGDRALLFYLVPYTAMSIGAFAVVAARERELGGQAVTIDQLWGFGWERPLLGVAMWVFMLGFAGLPLTGGFFGKFYAFAAAVDAGWTWLVIVGVAATAISLYYYLAVVRALYMRSPAELSLAPVGGSPPRDWLLQGTVAACLAITVATFIAVEPVIDLARDAAAALPFGP